MNKSEKMLISVIIPVYNVENYLRRCLDSVLNQTYKNLEIILVDDGSTDSSPVICDEYAKADERIKVIHKANGGAAKARNSGLDSATGEYICFVDSDDLINEEMIEKLYLSVKDNYDISVCGFWTCFEDAAIDYKNVSKKVYKETFSGNDTINVFGWNESVSSNSVWGKLIKKELFDGIRFPDYRTAEDLFVSIKLFQKAEKVCVTNEQLYYYICRKGSLMHGKKLSTDDTVAVCGELLGYYNNSAIDENLRINIINKLAFIELNTILDNYYLSIKRRLGKEEEEHHKQLYISAKSRYKDSCPHSFKFKLFEKSSLLYYLAMMFFTKIYHNEIV